MARSAIVLAPVRPCCYAPSTCKPVSFGAWICKPDPRLRAPVARPWISDHPGCAEVETAYIEFSVREFWGMEQRPLRLGDNVDDYCPRERRVTNHAIVAI